MIRVKSENITSVEVRMHSARKLYFDLDVKSKPDIIKIQNTDVLKNQNNLYEYVYDDGKTLNLSRENSFYVFADKYVPQYVSFEPNIIT